MADFTEQERTIEKESSIPKIRDFSEISVGAGPNKFMVSRDGRINIGNKHITISEGQNIQNAVDVVNASGGGIVFLQSGTYNISNDIILSSGVSLVGSGMFNTIIDFGGGAYSVKIDGSDAYNTGTLSATASSSTVTGSGTTWTSSMIGQSILISGDWYDIDNVVSTTEITLGSLFSGTTQSGLSYSIATINRFARIENITLQNSSTNVVEVNYCYVPIISFVAVYSGNVGINCQNTVGLEIIDGEISECATGLYMLSSYSFLISTEFIYDCTGVGFQSDGGGDASMFNFGISNNGGVGMKFTNTSKVTSNSFTIDSNISHGIEYVSGCNDNTLNSGAIHTNGGDGFKITATSDRNSVAQIQSIYNNTGYGVNIAAATCDNNIILGNNIYSNTAGQVSNSGTTTKIRSNIGVVDN